MKLSRKLFSAFLINMRRWKKICSCNWGTFHEKRTFKAIMKRSRLRKKFLKYKNEINRNNYKVQRNYCKELLKTTCKKYFNNLNTCNITDNRTFWKTVLSLWPFGIFGIGISASASPMASALSWQKFTFALRNFFMK